MKYYKVLLIVLLIVSSCEENGEQSAVKEAETTTVKKDITIYTIGDSTMANKPDPDENPERGWGQVLPTFLNEHATVQNHAVNGRSTRSFRDRKHWDPVYEQIQKGDYVFIQFGHNDQKKTDATRYTNPHTAYRHNLIRYIKETREKGGIPVLFTPIVRRRFNSEGALIDAHGVYPLEMRLVAREYDVPLIDLQYLTEQLEESYGAEDSVKLHLHFEPNEHSYIPKGITDNTHLSVLGATEIAKLAVEALQENIAGFDYYVKK